MPSRGIFSTGLPSRQPTARPTHPPCTRSRSAAPVPSTGGGAGHDAAMSAYDSGSSADAGSGTASQASSSSIASARRSAPPAAQRFAIADRSRPSSAAPASSWSIRSSGVIQESHLMPARPTCSDRRAKRARSSANTSAATSASTRAGAARSTRDASATGPDHSAGTDPAPPSAPAIAPAIVAVESASRP